MTDKKIAEAMGMKPIAEIEKENTEIVEAESTEIEVVGDSKDNDIYGDALEDLEFVRGNIHGILKHGNASLEDMIDLARQSESPRAFEVAATLMKTLLDANKEFVDVSTKKKDFRLDREKPDSGNSGPRTVNQNLFLSTKDLLKMISEKGEDDVE
jgi:hypothetical protein